MTTTNEFRMPPFVGGLTGRDGYLMYSGRRPGGRLTEELVARALKRSIAAIDEQPEETREFSDQDDMRRLLESYVGEHLTKTAGRA